MSRFARTRAVFYFEEPVHADVDEPALRRRTDVCSGVVILTPTFPHGTDLGQQNVVLGAMLDALVAEQAAARPILWFYTPMMFAFAGHVDAAAVVYDCMDELSNFRFAPPELPLLERRLMARANVMFTGGYSLFEAKRDAHPNVHAFPSSVDTDHFRVARAAMPSPVDQAALPKPRLGFYGVVDERMDVDLLGALAEAHPDWSIVVVGPVVKIDPATLPRRSNLHYFGGKSYAELPAYLSGWDVALMPFALNEATRFISPTKTLEYLAAGKPVVSTPVRDVVRHYADLEAVRIAEGPAAFVSACEDALRLAGRSDWLDAVDRHLASVSWDRTFQAMSDEIDAALQAPARPALRRRLGRPADVLVVGAGFAGSVMAERLASQSGKSVLVIDKRPHVGGNAYDEKDASGLLVHRYGPHIFHTNSTSVADYLSRFTAWRPYEHRVLAAATGPDGAEIQVPMPINRTTINSVYGVDLKSDAEVAEFLASRAEAVHTIRTSEDLVVSKVGRDLFERFFQGYTRKQWGMEASDLSHTVAGRVPTRTNDDDRYFTDSFQAMPLNGYTSMFGSMLDHPRIEVRLGTSFSDVNPDEFEHVVFTGPIDEYFGFPFGKLPYRSLRFDHRTLETPQFQDVGTVNYPDPAVPYTRITEFKHLTGQIHPKTSIVTEYPCADGDPYYPIPRLENHALFKRYEALAAATPHVTFVGRLATYRYYNMDQVVGQALSAYQRLAARWAGQMSPAAQAVAAE